MIHLPFRVKQHGRCHLLQRVHWLSVAFKNMHFVWCSVHKIQREMLRVLMSQMAGGKIQQSRPAPTHWWHRYFEWPGTDGSTLHWRERLVHRRHFIIGSGIIGMARPGGSQCRWCQGGWNGYRWVLSIALDVIWSHLRSNQLHYLK